MKKLAIIEDDAILLKSLVDTLSKNFKVVVATDGKEGLDMLAIEKPEVILLDIYMPQMDGISMLEQMRNDPILKDIPVIILSNYDDPEKIKRTSELGALSYLVKANNDLYALSDKITETLNKNGIS